MQPRNTVLLWDLNMYRRESARLTLLMADYDVRYVYDEADAFNMADILNQTGHAAACLMLRFVDDLKKLVSIFSSLKQSKFSAPVLLVLSEDAQKEVETIQTWVPEGFNVNFCLSGSTLDAVTGISGQQE